MAQSTVAVERRGDVVWCALDRPPLNLFEPGLIASLRTTFETLARDASVRAAVVLGRGRAFTAGMDVHVLHALNAASARTLISDLCAAIDAVHRAPFPVVAAVHGACLGAGFELALACDLRIATSDASFGLPEVRVGVPSVIQAALLPPLIGPGRAAEMLLLGARVDAPRALAWGLVNRVVEPADLEAAVGDTLTALLACAPAAVRAQKALMIRWRESDLPSAICAGIEAFAACYAGDEPREGAAAFLEKRAPRFETRAAHASGRRE
jgi:enoyl-CoA hydratase